MSEITITKEQFSRLSDEVYCTLAECATEAYYDGEMEGLNDDEEYNIAKSVVREFHPELTAEQVDALAEKIFD